MLGFPEKVIELARSFCGKVPMDVVNATMDYVSNSETHLAMETLVTGLAECNVALTPEELSAVIILLQDMGINIHKGELVHLIKISER